MLPPVTLYLLSRSGPLSINESDPIPSLPRLSAPNQAQTDMRRAPIPCVL